jgi:cytochrome c peroxidase
MIDGRENFQHPGLTIPQILGFQAQSATQGHAQAARPLTENERQQIVNFQLGLLSAQIRDDDAGPLTVRGATGGPEPLATEPFFIGINDPFGGNPTGKPFDTHVFNTFDAWAQFQAATTGRNAARGSVSRGQDLFNSHPIRMVGVSGITDDLGVTEFNGFCTTCHDTPNNGNHSVSGPVDLGLTTAERRLPDEPLYTFVHKRTGQIFRTTDPGRALISGLWKHLGRMKAPSLHSLAARAPYFHNGSAATLLDVVNFYDTRFTIGFTEAEKQDLVAFLRSL